MSRECCAKGFCVLGTDCRFLCDYCYRPITDEWIISREMDWMNKIADEPNPEEMINRGVSVQFLKQFTDDNGLWDKPTAWVTRNIIKERTANSRKRYIETLSNGDVGKATSFISHCWNGLWGLLVAAVCEDADPNKYVWIDIFAVRQWPSRYPDLDFEPIIKNTACASFILVCTAHPDFSNMSEQRKRDRKMESIRPEARKLMPFLRDWCILETVFAASKEEKMLFALKCVSFETEASGERKLRHDSQMMSNLFYFLDIRNAEATFSHDHERIFRQISEFGVENVNRSIRGVCAGSQNIQLFKPQDVEISVPNRKFFRMLRFICHLLRELAITSY